MILKTGDGVPVRGIRGGDFILEDYPGDSFGKKKTQKKKTRNPNHPKGLFLAAFMPLLL
jgi:hypothetical protein